MGLDHHDEDGDHVMEPGLRALHSVLAITITLAGVLSNLLSVMAIIKAKLFRHYTIVFIMNVLIIDLFICMTGLLNSAINSFSTEPLQEDFSCIFGGYWTYSLIGSEFFGVASISLNCFFRISSKDIYNKLYGRPLFRYIMLFFPTALSFAMVLLPLTGTWGNFSYGPSHVLCDVYHSEDGYEIFYAVTIFAISSPILIFCYIGIIRKYYKSRLQVGTSYTGEVTKNKGERQLLLNVIIMITSFILLYIPEAVLPIVDAEIDNFNKYVHVVASYIGWFHIIVNPLVYSIFNSKIRKAWHDMFCCKKSNIQQHSEFTVSATTQ